jgi:hypothetical protein
MKDEYYTPTIEDFHVGFEYEAEEIEKYGTSTYWKKYTFEINDSLELIFKPNDWYELPRVKYLDKDDIEDLGFIKGSDLYELKTNHTVIRLQHHNNNLITIWYYETLNGEFRRLVQQIKIKNKSELKKLLEQLNIK